MKSAIHDVALAVSILLFIAIALHLMNHRAEYLIDAVFCIPVFLSIRSVSAARVKAKAKKA